MFGRRGFVLKRFVPGRWSVYVVRCRDGRLYTGIATDVRRRIAEHSRKRGRGAKSLRGRGPLHLVFQRIVGPRGLALRVEGAIKKLPKAQKEELIVQEIRVDRLMDLARAEVPRRGISRRDIGTRTRRSSRRRRVADGHRASFPTALR